MKKIFALLLALLMLVSAIPFAAAVEAHTHFDDNNNGVCDYSGCSFDMSHTNHVDNDGDGICDATDCGATVAPPQDEDDDDDSADHEHYDNNNNGVCDYPGCSYEMPVAPTPDDDIEDPIGPGVGDDDDDDDDNTGIFNHTHTYSGVYKYNSTYHWRQCWCGKILTSSKVKHTFNSRGECTKCGYSKCDFDFDYDGDYRVYLTDSGRGETRLSTRYADYGEYVYIYVDPDNGYKVDDIEVHARYGYSYDRYDCYDYCDSNGYFSPSRYYGSTCSRYNCSKYNCSICSKYYGKEINVLKRSSTCYYFRMPASDVTVEVTYTGSSYKYNDTNAYGNYSDVSSNDWFYSAVNYVTRYEIMPGASYTKFSPNVNADRATIALALYNISGAKASGRENFSDVDSYDWFYDAVVWCSGKGIIEGWNGKFDPYGEVTREDFAVMMYRYAEYKRMDTRAAEDLSDYADADKISNYAVEAMEWAVAEGLINGVGNDTLAPQGTATRAQVAAVLMRFCKNVK